jgi:hypothetical protein
MNAPTEEAEAHAKVSKRENRLYIGNLAYDCNYKDLEKFMAGGELAVTLTLTNKLTSKLEERFCSPKSWSLPLGNPRVAGELSPSRTSWAS